jgi:hypothetical protein
MVEFLTIDHVNNDGREHRLRTPSQGAGDGLISFLKRSGYPDGFQVLCFNCNWAKGRYGGVCPHSKR